MNEYQIILLSLFVPEVFSFAMLFLDRKWLFNMIEDSDGDPHHNDGVFMILLYVALWSFRIGFICLLKDIYSDMHMISEATIAFGIGATIIGVRLGASKIMNTLSGTKNDKI